MFGSRRRELDALVLPVATLAGLRRHHPQIDDRAAEVVAVGLRQWYRVAQLAGNRPIAMPSQVVDDLWHEHITCTREYAAFCSRAFGHFLHHRPESAMTPQAAERNRGSCLRATYDLARKAEDVAMPLLFCIDEQLRVRDGRRYVASCGAWPCTAVGVTCLAHLPEGRSVGDSSGSSACGSGGSSWWGGDPGSDPGGGDSGSDGGSDGGGGCGGGGD